VDYSFWLAKATRSEEWFGKDKATREYVQERMLEIEEDEYVKIYDAIYDFHLLDLQVIDAPTLVLNGEYESKSVFRHSEEILKLVMGSEMKIVPEAGHTSNMENPDGFNILLQQFLDRSA
jgi:pimeloyl-ACP methyl ester carboxylesterase